MQSDGIHRVGRGGRDSTFSHSHRIRLIEVLDEVCELALGRLIRCAATNSLPTEAEPYRPHASAQVRAGIRKTHTIYIRHLPPKGVARKN